MEQVLAVLSVILQGERLPRELAGGCEGGGSPPCVQDGVGGPHELQRREVGPELPDPGLEPRDHTGEQRAATRKIGRAHV